MNSKKIISVRIVCFLILCCGLMYYFSSVLTTREFIEYPGRNGFFQNINAEGNNTIDVLYVGDSTVRNSVIPIQVYNDTGITSYVLSYAVMKPSEAYFDLKKTFEKQKPKHVFLEAAFLVTTSERSNVYKNDEIDNLVNYFEDQLSGEINYFLPVMKYKSEWKTRSFGDFASPHPISIDNYFKGYVFSKEIDPVPKSFKQSLKGDVKVNYSGDIYLRKILDLCEMNSCTLTLITIPHATSWNNDKHFFVQNMADNLGIGYIDYHYHLSELIPDFSWETDTSDGGGHLNYYGANKVTKVLSNYMLETLKLSKSDLTEEQYFRWKNDTQLFYSRIEE